MAYIEECSFTIRGGVELMATHYSVNSGTIEQACINRIAEWANSCERRLLGLHCGQTLDRRRHLVWAEEEFKRLKDL